MTYEIFFEYAEGGTDYKTVEAPSIHAAARLFRDDYPDRYILSIKPVAA